MVGQFHVDPFLTELLYRQRAEHFLEGTLAAAVEHKLPIWSAERFLYFTEGRQAARYTDISWDAGARRLTFAITCPVPNREPLELLIPREHGGAVLDAVTVDGATSPRQDRRVGGA